MKKEINTKLMELIERSPVSFHTIHTMEEQFQEADFVRLREEAHWDVQPGGKYYVVRGGSSIIAFKIPEHAEAFHIIATHSDSPTYKIKPGAAIAADSGLVRLNVEKYGGMIHSTWFDRPLSVAGRVMIDEGDSIRSQLVDFDRDLVMIPSLAIHMSRGSASDGSVSVQKELLPIVSSDGDSDCLQKLLREEAGVAPEKLLGADLFLYNRQKPTIWGADGAFLSAPRLDDLECCFCSFLAFLESEPKNHISMHCVFDNEEVGSETRQGAGSSFLKDTLERICVGLDMEYHTAIAKSFLVSADNAHACHPGYPEKSDPVNQPKLNGGIVLKHHAAQRYATDGVSAAIFRKLCKAQDIPYQEYTNHSDQPGGSTLGSIASAIVPLRTVDIGLPQLAMHSAYETVGAEDPAYLVRFAAAFYADPLPTVEA